jgi:lipoprotein NlpI
MHSCHPWPLYLRIAAAFLLLCSFNLARGQSSDFESLDQQIEENPKSAYAFQQRGVAHFKNSSFEKAISDFDRVIQLAPEQEAHHWQRGIAYYYSADFKKGVAQFELHQTVNSNDVENAIWHFICKVKADGLEAARQALIPIKHDSRVPMMEVWSLFAGEETPKGVLKSAQRKGPSGFPSRQSMCYAHLYLGLYFEATGQIPLAKQHIESAANKYSMDNYMGEVARIHHKSFERLKTPQP